MYNVHGVVRMSLLVMQVARRFHCVFTLLSRVTVSGSRSP